MKTKMLLTAALLGAAALTANAGVHFGFSIRWPAPVVISTPVVYATPVVPEPRTMVQTVPPCPGVGYVWAAGYWSNLPTGRVWVPGAWQYCPSHVTRVNERHDARYGDAGHQRNDRHDGHDRGNGHEHDGYRR